MESENSAEHLHNLVKSRNEGINDKKNRFFSEIEYCTPIEGISLIDFKIQKVWEEDKIYQSDDDVYNTLRRGNSILLNKNTNSMQIARIGLPKFFDYKKQYQGSNDNLLKKRVLGEIEKSSGKFQIYFTDKANGENLQISYNKTYKCWIIGSKNVSILLRNEGDLNFYSKTNEKIGENLNRFSFALDFGRTWFNILKERFTEDKLSEFINELGDHTLIGESVGDPNHQHIKIYSKRDILFYAIVKNEPYNKQLCFPPNQTFKLLEKYGLSHVTYKCSKILNDFNELKQETNKIYDELLVTNIDIAGEGNVAYFVEVNENGERVLSLAKLKSFEYRYYRKIREKCKTLKGKKPQSVGNAMGKLRKEAIDLIEDKKNLLPKPFEEYMDFGLFVLMYQSMNLDWDYSDRFALFLNEISNQMKNGVKIENINSEEINKNFGRYIGNKKEENNENDKNK